MNWQATIRRGSVTLIVLAIAGALGLSGCSGTAVVEAQDVSTTQKAEAVDCKTAKSATSALAEAQEAPPGKKNGILRSWGFDPASADAHDVKASLEALNRRIKACAEGEASAKPSASVTETSSPSPTPTITAMPSETAIVSPSASATPSATPTPTATPQPAPTYVGWDQIVASPPAGLKATITNHSDQLKFSWSDAQAWAKVRTGNGKAPNALVVLSFQDYDSDAAARKAAGVKNDKVAVVRVTSCDTAVWTECPDGGAVAILAPLVEKDGDEYVLRVGSGVVLTKDYPVVVYTAG